VTGALRRTLLACAGISLLTAAASAEPLRVVGNTQVFEIAPLVLASKALPEGSVDVSLGGVPNLWDVELSSLTLSVSGDGPSKPRPSGQLADLAGNAETQLLHGTVAHRDGRYLLTVVEGIYRLVGRRSRGIANEADLKGKTIATMPGTSAAFYLHRLLDRAHLSEHDVTIVPLSPKAAADALIAGKVDAMSMWEPHAEDAVRALGRDAVVIQPVGEYREVYSLHTKEAVLSDPRKRSQVVAYVRALITACNQIAKDPRKAQELLSAVHGRTPNEIAAAWQYNFVCKPTPAITDLLVEEERWLAAQESRAPRTRDEIARLVDTSVFGEARRLSPERR